MFEQKLLHVGLKYPDHESIITSNVFFIQTHYSSVTENTSHTIIL